MDENDLEGPIENVDGMRDETINISDVIEVIEADPDCESPSAMFNGGGEIPAPAQPAQVQQSSRRHAEVRILEQPAAKALRFRYECEGRSAGSIPGENSTPENKTFPTIQIVGYRGRAVVVVSCVTKDQPYRPHPHNLVGREGCKRGVCTLEISPETMTVSFSNLGIQCVKKKDIENALRVREEIRVDPFRTGFSHRNQPTSIDLNSVRLCFQVFLEGQQGKFTVPLTPVVSQVIHDKKAMSDLTIIKLSDCVSYVDGGRKDIILLCEKVAKEDIQIRFYEEQDGQTVWEAFGDFQPSQVHKQHAIWFRAPRYHTLDVTEPVKVNIQLRRPSDGATSEPLPFELLPLDSGRPPYWSYRRNLSKKGNYSLFKSILANDELFAKKNGVNGDSEKQIQTVNLIEEVTTTTPMVIEEECPQETNNNEEKAVNKETEAWCDYSEVKRRDNKIDEVAEEKQLSDLINQVAELDEIYSETHAKLVNENLQDLDKPLVQNESFDDSRTYTSLQLAFKNPLEIEILKTYDEEIVTPTNPIVSVSNKRENEVEKLPPLPPKRAKKIETYIGGSMSSIQLSGKQAENVLPAPNPNLRTVSVSRSHSFNLPRPQAEKDIAAPRKCLPPTPTYSTLPNPKKRGFFSKLFGRKNKTPGTSRETSAAPSKRNSFSSSKSLQIENILGRSSGNISTHSSTSIRIPLKDSPTSSSLNITQSEEKKILNVVSDDLDFNLDLTEAEHYALYTTMAPHATQSEFDEMSCYYAPVEGGKLLTNAEVAARLASKT